MDKMVKDKKPKAPKFSVGEKVFFKNESYKEVGEVLGYTVDDQKETFYRISSRSIDMERKEVLEGVKSGYESELEKADLISEEKK